MYRVYSAKRGIEFRWDVKSKILAVMLLTGLILVFTHLDLILEYMIAGF